MRDLTDTMYNPKMEPRVSHFRGTDLVVEHIEKYVCSTVTSNQILGGAPYRFETDPRKHLVFLIGERQYKTRETLPAFAEKHLASEFRLSFVHAGEVDGNRFAGIEAVEDADVLFVSVRRRALPEEDLALIRRHVTAGKPVVGIRTASHAFSLRGKPAPDGHASWEKWDAEVLGGNYHGHHRNNLKTVARVVAGGKPGFLDGVGLEGFVSRGSLYRNAPLQKGANAFLMGKAESVEQEEPLAWSFIRKDGGRSWYTSLGHVSDFAQEPFRQMLVNGVMWAAGVSEAN